MSDFDTVVSYSEIFKWQVCQRQYYYRYILNRKPIEESDAITTGTKGHKLLQFFYECLREGFDKEAAWNKTHIYAKHLMTEGNVTNFDLLKAWTLVDNYIRETDFTAKAILIESRFLFPASVLDPDPILARTQIGFTPDLVLERKGGKLDVEDYKFVQRAWSKSKINRFQQLKLYQIFLERMGYDISRTVLRFFNTTTAKIITQPYTMTKTEEDTLISDFMAGVKEVVRYKTQPANLYSTTPRTMNYTACSYCPFEFPCTLEAEGKDASRTLKNMYKTGDYDYTR